MNGHRRPPGQLDVAADLGSDGIGDFLSEEDLIFRLRILAFHAEIGAGFLNLGEVGSGRREGLLPAGHIQANITIGCRAHQLFLRDRAERILQCIGGEALSLFRHKNHICSVGAELRAHLPGYVIVDGHKSGEDRGPDGDRKQGDQHARAASQERGGDHPQEHFSL